MNILSDKLFKNASTLFDLNAIIKNNIAIKLYIIIANINCIFVKSNEYGLFNELMIYRPVIIIKMLYDIMWFFPYR